MATRDWTDDFQHMRSAYHRNVNPADTHTQTHIDTEGGADSLSASAAHVSVDVSALAGSNSPLYVESVNEINADIDALQQKITTLQRVQDRRIKAFSPEEQQEHEREVDILTSEITRQFNAAGARLKKINATESTAEDADLRVRKNIQRGMATRLHDLSNDFKRQQKSYIGHITKQRQKDSIDSLVYASEQREDVDEGFTDEQMNELARQREDVDERLNDIRRIAQQVEQLAVLFKEMAALVIEQGTILDRIDRSIDEAVERSAVGLKEIKVAEQYQKSARPIKCMLLLMVLIVICVIIIIAKTADM